MLHMRTLTLSRAWKIGFPALANRARPLTGTGDKERGRCRNRSHRDPFRQPSVVLFDPPKFDGEGISGDVKCDVVQIPP
jgi:hypothetical protein